MSYGGFLLAATAAKSGTKPVNVVGFADPTGSKKSNILMSQLRAQCVADLLHENGLAVDRIRLQGRGSVKFAINAQESRRVEIGTGAR